MPKAIINFLYTQYHFDHVVVSATHTHSGFVPKIRAVILSQQLINKLLVANKLIILVKFEATQSLLDESYNRIVHKDDGVDMLWTILNELAIVR